MRLVLIGLVSMGGAVLGWDTAAVTHSARTHHVAPLPNNLRAPTTLPHTSTLVIVPVPAGAFNEESRAQELARLEARNRRLEALVRILRNRESKRKP